MTLDDSSRKLFDDLYAHTVGLYLNHRVVSRSRLKWRMAYAAFGTAARPPKKVQTTRLISSMDPLGAA